MTFRDYQRGEVRRDGRLSRRGALKRWGLLGLAAVSGSSGVLVARRAEPPPAAAGYAGPPPGRGPATPEAVTVTFPGPSARLHGCWAAPAGRVQGAVLVLHDDAGLTDHVTDVVGRLAGAGYGSLCVELPARSQPIGILLGDLSAGIAELRRRLPAAKVGAIGFGFGGTMLWDLLAAGEQRLAAAVPFYGPAPDEPDFSRARAAVLAIYGQLDRQVNETQDKVDYKLLKANLERVSVNYQGADHAFFDDTDPRYNPVAASQSWQATLSWLGRHL